MNELDGDINLLPKQEVENDFECGSPNGQNSQSPTPDDAFPCFDPTFVASGAPLEYVMSSKGLPKLIDNGFMFLRYRVNADRISWRCELSSSHHCRAKVFTIGDNIVKRLGEHSHAGNAAKIEIAKVMEMIYHRAQNTTDNTSKIVNDAISLLSPASVSQLPNINSIKRHIHRNRSKKESLPPLPQTADDFVIHEEYQCTESGLEFLKADVTRGEDRFLVFTTDKMLEILCRCETWFIASSLKLALPIFNKLYVVLGVFNEIVVPLVYVLMSSTKEEIYMAILSKLLELEPSLNPRTIFGDFEIMNYSAVVKIFPDVAHYGSFFQFCQIYYTNVQSFGLQHKYQSDAEFALKLRLLPALAFISCEEITTTFESLALCSNFPAEAVPLMDYFEDTWIGRPVCGKARRSTMFPMQFWNCADIADFSVVKFNSLFEAWHRYFNSQLTSPLGANVWKLIKFLKSDEAKNDVFLTQLFNEGEVKGVVSKWQPKLTYKKLENVLMAHDRTNVLDFLNSVASCLFF